MDFSTCNFEYQYADYLTDLHLNLEKGNREFMSDRTTVFVPGKIYWCKVLGTPRTNYEGTGREWTYELEPDDTSFLKEHRLLDRLKNKYDDRGPFLTLKKPELDSKGETNEPIRVYNSDNEAWDPNTLIGNGTRVVAKLSIVDWGKGKKQSIYTQAIRVEELVPYVSSEFGGYDSEASPAKATKRKTTKEKIVENLDDDLPFD